MPNNSVHRTNVVTRRAAAELTGAATHYRGVRPNIDNNDNNNINDNNHGALAELFQPGTLHRLRQLGLCTNTDTPGTAHQLDAEAVAAEVAYTMTNTQLCCSGGGELDRVPSTFKEAMGLPQAARWKTASDKEIASLEKRGIFDLVPITSVPAGHKVVGNKWVFKIKADGTYKGQLVVQGFLKISGVDCSGTFAPVCRLQSIYIMLVIAVELNYEVHMLDVQTAFLNADVEADVLVKMVPGYETNNEAGVYLVMKLKKSLYGLRQSPKNWFSTMDVELAIIGFRPLKSDPCVYVYEDETGFAVLTLYVNDILFLSASKPLLNKLKKKLMNRFEMSDMGGVSRILGTNVTRDREKGTITVNQKDYTEDVVQRYGMKGCNPVYTPGVGPELSLSQPEEKLLNEEEKRRYQAITGAVMYLAQLTRYDILYADTQLARAMSKPAKAHMGAVKHLLRYLAGSKDFSITYKQGGFRLVAFSDANWGNNPDNGRSTSLYIVMLANDPISFKVGLQGLTAQSTMEAELVAAALAMKEAMFCSNIMLELGFGKSFGSVPLYIDSTSALHVAGNRTYSPRAKHIALKYFFVQELVEEGKVSIHYVKSEDQLADLGTKHHSKHRHRDLIKFINEFKA